MKYTIERTGMRPLSFEGERIFYTNNRNHNSTRWTYLDVYQTQGGKIVVAVDYISQWEGEKSTTNAHVFSSKEEALSFVENEEPWAATSLAKEFGISETIE